MYGTLTQSNPMRRSFDDLHELTALFRDLDREHDYEFTISSQFIKGESDVAVVSPNIIGGEIRLGQFHHAEPNNGDWGNFVIVPTDDPMVYDAAHFCSERMEEAGQWAAKFGLNMSVFQRDLLVNGHTLTVKNLRTPEGGWILTFLDRWGARQVTTIDGPGDRFSVDQGEFYPSCPPLDTTPQRGPGYDRNMPIIRHILKNPKGAAHENATLTPLTTASGTEPVKLLALLMFVYPEVSVIVRRESGKRRVEVLIPGEHISVGGFFAPFEVTEDDTLESRFISARTMKLEDDTYVAPSMSITGPTRIPARYALPFITKNTE